jgi:hypothetical protein
MTRRGGKSGTGAVSSPRIAAARTSMARAPTSVKCWWIVVSGGVRKARLGDVVEPDHGNLVRHESTCLVQRAQDPERHLVVAREDGRHGVVRSERSTGFVP